MIAIFYRELQLRNGDNLKEQLSDILAQIQNLNIRYMFCKYIYLLFYRMTLKSSCHDTI